jgi:glyoxylase-like metal-dependent hydrolase (beta-lactamase superfamily II)
VGDTLFPGGPGHSETPEDLAKILTSLQRTLFAWPDEVYFMPGHGSGSTIGAVRPAYEAFLARPRPADLCGDIEWT